MAELRADDPRDGITEPFRYANRRLSERSPGFAIDPELPLGPGDLFPCPQAPSMCDGTSALAQLGDVNRYAPGREG